MSSSRACLNDDHGDPPPPRLASSRSPSSAWRTDWGTPNRFCRRNPVCCTAWATYVSEKRGNVSVSCWLKAPGTAGWSSLDKARTFIRNRFALHSEANCAIILRSEMIIAVCLSALLQTEVLFFFFSTFQFCLSIYLDVAYFLSPFLFKENCCLPCISRSLENCSKLTLWSVLSFLRCNMLLLVRAWGRAWCTKWYSWELPRTWKWRWGNKEEE